MVFSVLIAAIVEIYVSKRLTQYKKIFMMTYNF